MTQKPTYEELEQKIRELEQVISGRERVMEALRESQARFQLLYEKIPLGYQSLDEDGKFFEVNQTWLDTLGYIKEEVIGRSFCDFLHSDWTGHFNERFSRFKSIGEVLGQEYKMLKKDGSTILVSFNGRIERDERGEFVKAHCILIDITKQRQAEEDLLEKKETFRLISENIQDVFWMSTPGIQNILYVSPAYEKIWGRSCESLYKSPSSFIEAIHPEDRKKVQDEVDKHTTRTWGPIEYRIVQPDGSIRWICNRGFPIKDMQGDLIKLTGVATDITKRKLAEEELSRWARLFRHARWGIATSEDRKTIHAINPAFAKIHGFTMEELKGKLIVEMFAPNVRLEASKHIEKAYTKGHHTFESHHIRKDGSVFPCLIDITAVKDDKGHAMYHVAHVHDITDSKKKELKIIKSEGKYRALFENASEGILLLDNNGVIIDVNSQMLYFLGYDRHDMIEKKVIDFIHPHDLKAIPFIFSKIDENKTVQIERRLRKKDGKFIILEVNTKQISDNLILALYRDTSERKKAENALRLSKEKLNKQAHTLKKTNKALSILLDHRAEEKSRFERNILDNVKKLIIPSLEQMKKTKKKKDIVDYLNIVERNLKEITSAFSTELTSKHIYLTQTELRIANLIKMGKTSKEIAPLIGVTPKTVFFHRENIRKKLGLTHRKINLRSYLITIL